MSKRGHAVFYPCACDKAQELCSGIWPWIGVADTALTEVTSVVVACYDTGDFCHPLQHASLGCAHVKHLHASMSHDLSVQACNLHSI